METCLAETGANIYAMIAVAIILILITGSMLMRGRRSRMSFGGSLALVLGLGVAMTSMAPVTLHAVPVCEPGESASALPDSSTGIQGASQVFNVLANDTPTPGAHFVLSSLELDLAPGFILGSSVSDDRKTVTAPTEGEYTAGSDGKITYHPDTDFIGNAVGVRYSIQDSAGKRVSSIYAPVVTAGEGPVACSDDVEPVLLDDVWLGVSNDSGTARLANVSPSSVDMAVSPNGQWLLAAGLNTMDYSWQTLYRSGDGGVTWQELTVPTGIAYPEQVTISDDGQRLVVVAPRQDSSEGVLLVSSDGGATWQERFVVPMDRVLRVSPNGAAAAEIAYGEDGVGGYVRVTTNDGATWSNATVPSAIHWGPSAVRLSDDGATLVLTGATSAGENVIAVSSDAGATWNTTGFNDLGLSGYGSESLSVSPDGSHVVFTGNTSTYEVGLYVTSDNGVSWQERQDSSSEVNLYEPVLLGNDGLTVTGGTMDDAYVFNVSNDGGETWSQRPGVMNIRDIAMSSDGSVLAGYDRHLLQVATSTDMTASWQTTQIVPFRFNPAHVDLDTATPGQQLAHSEPSKGWWAEYDPALDILTFTVTDDALFNSSYADYPEIEFAVLDPSCGTAVMQGYVQTYFAPEAT